MGRRKTLLIAGAGAVVLVVAIAGVVYVRHGDTSAGPLPIPIAAPPPANGEQLLATMIDSPTALAVLPGNRILVTGQNGTVRLVDRNGLEPTPVLAVDTKANDEEGLTGIVVDPEVEQNNLVYVYYTAQSPHHHQRVSRFTLNGDTVVPDSEQVLIDLPDNSEPFHLGGAMTFLDDGTLLVGTGEHAGNDPQSLDSVAGKVLRINTDGSIPQDDPFFGQQQGLERAIWAYGFRNPYAMATGRSGRVLLSDVGEDKFEEINQVERGANYGWPKSEGPTTDPGQTSPVFAYGREDGCAIIGGAFADDGTYLFMDYCKGTIRRFDPASKAVTEVGVITGEGPAGIATIDGDIVYIERGLVYLDGGTGQGFDQGAVYRRAG